MLKLVNFTPVPAALHCAPRKKFQRIGVLVAKATFRTDGERVELDTQDPLPILRDDQATSLGILPKDLDPPQTPGCEVIVLGKARAPQGQAVEQMTVALRVGTVERRMVVTGDRTWIEGPHGFRPTRPVPFTEMTLDWDRAFGGTCKVWVDTDAVLEVANSLNARGRGFDPRPVGRAVCQTLRAPPGFPVIDDPAWLPNLEDPEHLVRNRGDEPVPWCWATIPADIGMRCSEAMLAAKLRRPLPVIRDPGETIAGRAHPVWRLAALEAGARVVLHGFHAAGPRALRLPRIRICADYVLTPDRSGTVECRPYRLLLLPEEDRFCLCFCKHFVVDPIGWGDNSFRLRLEEGWYDA